jgi:hypothetical protein
MSSIPTRGRKKGGEAMTMLDLIRDFRDPDITVEERHAALLRLGRALAIAGPVLEGKNTWRFDPGESGAGTVQSDCERPYADFAEFEAESGYYESDLDRIPSELYLSVRYGIPLARDVQALETG